MTVRRAEERDLDQVAGLVSDFHMESTYNEHEVLINMEKTKFVLKAYLDGDRELVFFNVMTDPNGSGRVVGFMIGERIPDLWTDLLRTIEVMLYVQPAYRGKFGAGRLLLDFAQWASLVPSIVRIEASGGVDNDHSAKLYEKLGYGPRGVLHGTEVLH